LKVERYNKYTCIFDYELKNYWQTFGENNNMKKNILLLLLLFGIISVTTSQDKPWQPHEIQTYGGDYKQVPPFLNQPDNPGVFPNLNISRDSFS
jgi:hypothetical protein